MNTRKLFWKTTLIAILALSFSITSHAQNSDRFTIVPADPNAINPNDLIYEAKPGDTIKDAVYAKNLSDIDLSLAIYATDATIDDKGKTIFKTRSEPSTEAGTWVNFTETDIYLKSSETKKIPFTIKIPQNTAFGDYISGIAIEKVRPDANAKNLFIATRIVLEVNIKVTDNPKEIPKKYPQKLLPPFQTLYFWITLILFIGSIIALITLSVKSRKKRTHARKKT